MDLGLRGRRALITGGSRHIGFAVAEALAAEGAAVGLIARDAAGLAAAAERLGPRDVPVATAIADVTDTPQLKRAVDDIATALGGLDHLVANAAARSAGATSPVPGTTISPRPSRSTRAMPRSSSGPGYPTCGPRAAARW